MKICPDCLSNYKHSRDGKAAKKTGIKWGANNWPLHVYHYASTRKCEKHHAQSLADGAARRAGINKATPKWADRKAIKCIFEQCIATTKATGQAHEVDHIVPLNGVNVSGLNVHWNLQIIPATMNRAKSNTFDLSM